MNPDDASLVRQFQNGSREAFEKLYERYRSSVYSYVYYRVSEVTTAEDITSEVFIKALKRLDRYVYQQKPLAPWLFTIARNLIIDHYRKAGRQQQFPLDESMEAGKQNGVAQVVEKKMTEAGLMNALPTLTEDQQQVILLKFLEGRSNAEVAAMLGKTEGAIKSIQHRALGALKRAMEKEYGYE